MPRAVKKLLPLFLCLALLAFCAPQRLPESVSEPAPAGVSTATSQEAVASVPASPPPSETSVPLESLSPSKLPEPEVRSITLVATGDLMVHNEQMLDAWDAQESRYDFSHSFAQVAGDLREGDLSIGNLETVLGGPEIGYSDYPRFNTPDSFGVAIADAGFTFVSTANNHCMDKDEPGLLRTLETLDRLGLPHTGTFASPADRDAICVLEVETLRVALLSYTFSTNGIPVPEGKEHLVNMLTEQLLFDDLARARELKPDLIVVMPHMGDEYQLQTHPAYAHWMEQMVYHGADIVLAHHPHVLQPMRMYPVTDIDGRERTGFIIHSLGNFLSSQQYEPRERSILLKLDISKRGDEPAVIDRVRFVPTWVQFRDEQGGQLIRVLPIYDAIQSYKSELGQNPLSLRSSDIDKLYRINSEITALYLGAPETGERMRREYVFYQREEPSFSQRT